MDVTSFTSQNLSLLIAKLQGAMDALEGALAPGNDAIVGTMIGALPVIYTPRLAKHWQTESAVTSGGAMVRVWSESPFVYGYEYGTRPHPILPRNRTTKSGRPPALAFEGLVVRRVQHPGTKHHHRAHLVVELLHTTAPMAWAAAIQAALEA